MLGLFDGTPLERPITCDRCKREIKECNCPPEAKTAEAIVSPSDQHPRVRREKRRGKWNTVISDLDPNATELKSLLKTLRTNLGTGGGISNGELVIQGDHRETVVAKLVELGYKAKAAGG